MKTLQTLGSLAMAAALLGTAAARATTTCNDGGQIWVSKYILINNMWGKSCDTSGWNCIWNSTSGSPLNWGTSYNWHIGCSQYQVKAFPSVVSGWFWGTWSSGSGLPTRIWDNKNVATTGNYSIQNAGIQDVAYDCWFHTSSSGGTPSDEMMIWVGTYGGAGPLGTYQGTASIAGASWNIYKGWNSSGWNVYSFVRTSNTTSWSFNIRDFVWYVVYTKGWMSNSKFLTSVEFGTEPFSSNGNGQLNVGNYKVDVY